MKSETTWEQIAQNYIDLMLNTKSEEIKAECRAQFLSMARNLDRAEAGIKLANKNLFQNDGAITGINEILNSN